MKFITGKQTLTNALMLVGKGITTSSISALSHYLFDINDGVLNIVTTNLQLLFSKKIKVEANGGFKICVPGSILNLIKDLPDQPLIFDIQGNILTISTPTGKYSLPTEPGEDFPLGKFTETGSLDINSGDLLEAMYKTGFAASLDELRPAFTGVYFEFEEDGLRLTGTNTYILSTFKTPIKATADKLIVPRKAILALQGVKMPEDNIKLLTGENGIEFHIDDTFFIRTRVIDEKFPDYKSILPNTFPDRLKVSPNDIISVAKRFLQLTVKESQDIFFDLGEKVYVAGENKKFNIKVEENINATYEGDALRIYFRAENLINCLGKFDSDVYMFFSSPNLACAICETPEYNKDKLMVIVPVIF